MSNSLVLVINSGSSSLKFALIDTVTGDAMLNGLGECFFLPEAVVSWKVNGEKHEYKLSGLENHHQQAIDRIVALVDDGDAGASLGCVRNGRVLNHEPAPVDEPKEQQYEHRKNERELYKRLTS